VSRVSYRFLASVVLLSGLAAGHALAATYVVKADASGGFATIQAAIGGASNADVIELADGIFTGGGAKVAHGTFTSCTFVGNQAGSHGGGVSSEYDDTAFVRTIVSFSLNGEGVCEIEDRGRHMSFTCCGVFEDNFSLCANSRCLPGGNGCVVQIGSSGQGCEECDSPTTPSTWGMVKMRYR
jgi:predicted outer membrane repeat protein